MRCQLNRVIPIADCADCGVEIVNNGQIDLQLCAVDARILRRLGWSDGEIVTAEGVAQARRELTLGMAADPFDEKASDVIRDIVSRIGNEQPIGARSASRLEALAQTLEARGL